MKQDQEVRKPGAVREWAKVDKENQIWLGMVIDKFGWPGKSLVGRDGAHAAWMLAQHATQGPPVLDAIFAEPKSPPLNHTKLGRLIPSLRLTPPSFVTPLPYRCASSALALTTRTPNTAT